MKKTFILLLACVAMTACKDDKDKVQLDPHAKITLNGATSATPSASAKSQFTPPYTVQTVIVYAWDMTIKDPNNPNGASYGIINRDIEAGKLVVGQADQVVAPDGEGGYKLGWMVQGLYDVLCRVGYNADDPTKWISDAELKAGGGTLGRAKMDTIGYVPKAVILKAEADIKAAFDAGEYERCMTLFETAYTFVPITGAEWRALKAAGVE